MRILERFFRKNEVQSLVLAVAVSLLAQSCAYVTPVTPGTVAGYVNYMNQAAQADDAAWRRMKTEAETDYQQARTLTNQLRIGLLLTTPNRTWDNMEDDLQEGRRLLQDVLERNDPRLGSGVRALVNIRLQEVAAREGLHQRLRNTGEALRETEGRLKDTQGKLDELLDIENSMENERQQNEGRRR